MPQEVSAMRFHSSISDHEDSHQAVEQVIGDARSAMNGIDVAFVFFTGDHREEAPAILEQLWLELDPQCIVGCSAEGVIGGEVEIERSPGLSLLVAQLPGVQIHPFHIGGEEWRAALLGDEPELPERMGCGPLTRAVIGFGDPFTTPLNQLLSTMNLACPGIPLIGGMASSARAAGENILARNDGTLEEGFVGVSLSGPVAVDTVVSQGCRPIGNAMVVTRGKGNVIEALGGKPPLGALREFVDAMSAQEQALLRNGLFLGRAISEYRDTFGRGDFLVSNLMGADEKSGAIAVNGDVRVGQTVQFHVRDAATADEDLRLLLDRQQRDGASAGAPAGALLFSCNGRGTRMFPEPGHDIGLSRQILPATPVAGFFAAGELGPVGGKNFVHGHTASFALLRPRKD
jgi:small ligand-binding sensory domain FIST